MGSIEDQEAFRVSYMIVGTQKGGTTALDWFLSNHHDICTALTKEPHFFDIGGFLISTEPNYQLYHLFFSHYVGQKAIGEASPTYMYAPQVAQRLKNYNPKLKLIFLLRNPVERAYSQYNMQVRKNMEPLPFSEALRQEETRLQEAEGNFLPNSPFWINSYVSRGFYMKQIKNMLRYFPCEQMLFLLSEDLLERQQKTLTQVYNFLEVDASCFPERRRIHTGEYEPISVMDKAYLLKLYSQEIDELEKFLGRDLSDWRK